MCHEKYPTWEHCQPIIENAKNHGVQRLEIAGDAQNATGNLHAYILFEKYPEIIPMQHPEIIKSQIKELRKICQRAHELGMQIDIWHREVSLSIETLCTIKGVINEYGDIDFTGSFLTLIQTKIEEFFQNVPEIDGLVLTLTESSMPVLHVVNKDKNPPVQNIKNVIQVVKDVCQRHNKRLTVRPFAALDEDYQYINEALHLRDNKDDFAVEVKVVPYDWNPFLPVNPNLEKYADLSLIVELDLMGEYYGQGFVPCCFPEEIKRYIAYIKEHNIPQIVGRVDRLSNRALDSVNDINVLAMTRAWDNPEIAIDDIYTEWICKRWDEKTAQHIIPILKRTFGIAKKTFYLDEHLISHWHFINFEMSKWCWLYGLFKPGEKLYRTRAEWAILSHKTTPSWQDIIEEKDTAIAMIDGCLKELETVKSEIHAEAYEQLQKGFQNFLIIAKAYRQLFKLIIAYLRTIQDNGQGVETFQHEKAEAYSLIDNIATDFGENFFGGLVGDFRKIVDNIFIELDIELQITRDNNADESIVDWVLCGGISHEWRVRKTTHNSHVYREGNIIYRLAGNNVLADGFFEYELDVTKGEGALKIFWGDTGEIRECMLSINGKAQKLSEGDINGFQWIEVPLYFNETQTVPIRVTKCSKYPPMISQIQTCMC